MTTTRHACDTLLVNITDRVAVITINRPDVRNAISPTVQTELRDALEALRDDDNVGAVIFTGAGERACVAGADIHALRHYTMHTALDSRMQRLFDQIEAFPKPTIAAVNGYALGGGCELAMACDIRIASTTARFGLPEVGLPILPGAGGTQRLTRLVGLGRAVDLILTGRIIDADEARTVGLVTRTEQPDHLLAAAVDVAQQILAKGPLAVQLGKLVVRSGVDVDERTGLVLARLAQALLYSTADMQEAVDAFLAKRTSPSSPEGRPT